MDEIDKFMKFPGPWGRGHPSRTSCTCAQCANA